MPERSEYDLLRAQTPHENAMAAPYPKYLDSHYTAVVRSFLTGNTIIPTKGSFIIQDSGILRRDTGVILNLSASIGGVIYYLERTK